MRPSKYTLMLTLAALIQGTSINNSLAQELAEAGTATPASTVALLDEAARAQALADRDAYLRTIAELEARPGNYGSALGEAWFGLGTTLRTLDDQAQAAEAFGKALQALRIGFGLNDIRQLPALEQLRDINTGRRKWDEVHAATNLIFHITKHSAEADEDLRVKAALSLGHWLRKAATDQLIPVTEASHQQVTELYESEINRLEATADYAGKPVHLAALYLDLAATELGEAKRKYDMPISEFQTPGAGEQRTTVTQQCFTAVDRTGRVVQACNQPMEVPNINYYLAPNAQKSSEIRAHLSEVEEKVMAAFYALQEQPDQDAVHKALLAEMHRLTGEYNAFVALNPKN